MQTKDLFITVEDINDNGPKVFETGRDLTIPAGSPAGTNLPELLKTTDRDLEDEFKTSEAVIIEEKLRCKTASCASANPYFEINSQNAPGLDSNFTITTSKQIPKFEDGNYFFDAVLTIQIFNSRAPFAYNCDKAVEIADSRCYAEAPEFDQTLVGHLYTEIDVTVTILDEDHQGYLWSEKSLLYWDDPENVNKLKSDMDQMFKETLTKPSYAPENKVLKKQQNLN